MSVNRDGVCGKAAINIAESAEVNGGNVKRSKERTVAHRTTLPKKLTGIRRD
jgi:hypothetical protein